MRSGSRGLIVGLVVLVVALVLVYWVAPDLTSRVRCGVDVDVGVAREESFDEVVPAGNRWAGLGVEVCGCPGSFGEGLASVWRREEAMEEGNDNRSIRSCRADMDVRGGNVDDVAYYHSERYCGAIVNEPDHRQSKCVSSYRPYLLAPGKIDVECNLLDFIVFV